MAQQRLIIDFWDVGQGDGTVIRLPDGRLFLIDVGPRGSPIVDWLADHRPNVQGIVITHNDADHAGALPSIVKMPGISVERVYMLQDRDKRSVQFQRTWRPVREEEIRGRLSVLGLAKDTVVWQQGELSLRVVYPSFSENVEAKRPNETSAIVCLLHKADIKVIWPGDAPMQVVADKCSGGDPHLLHGPHHGGPVDRQEPQFKGWVQSLKPERLFVSVGTNNAHGLPSKPYLRGRVAHGCRVLCTQLTQLCDSRHISARLPVLQTAALLGLRAAKQGIACRGCLRIVVEGGAFLSDPWDSEHLKRVMALKRPQCV